jgi:hypothetical protein
VAFALLDFGSHIVAKQLLSKCITAEPNAYDRIEELLYAKLSTRSVSYLRKVRQNNCSREGQQQFTEQLTNSMELRTTREATNCVVP